MSEFKKILPFFGLALLVITIGGLLGKGALKFPGSKDSNQTTKQPEKLIIVAGKKINVEVANTEELRRKGLSGQDTLDENSGMLFAFDKKDLLPTFWMKDTKIALDFIWINDDKVSQITDNVQPEPSIAENKLKIYAPDSAVDYVLEVNAGFAQKNNIKSGDSVDLSEAIDD